jgi:uncharacterized protein
MSESAIHSPAASSSLVLKIRPRSDTNGAFSTWHAKMTMAPTDAPGFISTEVNAPTAGDSNEWTVTQHFRRLDQLNNWRHSERCRTLLEEAKAFADPEDPRGLCEEIAADGTSAGVVTEVVTTYVKPGRDREYQIWAERMHSTEAQFPGYRGGFLQPPLNQKQHYWTTLVRFATPEQLDAWLNSPRRQNLLREHAELVSSWEHHRLPNSFAGWFPTDAISGESPKSWKQSMLVVLMLFPIVMLEMRFLNPLMRGLNLAQGTFIGNVISVFVLAWPFMPLAILGMNWWLLPAKDAPKWITPAGIALLLALYITEIVVLSLLF